jgi:argininosuccinate lyase
LESMKVNRQRMRANASAGFANATDLADYLVNKGLPFREAHEVVGRMVLYCIENGKTLGECTLEEFHRFTPLVESDIHRILEPESVVESRNIPGGTAREAVLHTLSEKKRRIAETFRWTTTVNK